MSVTIYPNAKLLIANGDIDFNAPNDFRVLLLKSTAVYDSTDVYVDDVITGVKEINAVGYARQTLTGEGTSLATPVALFDAANPTFPAMAAGQTVGAMLLFKWVTSNADSPAIAWYDGDIFPHLTNGGVLEVQINAEGLIKFA